MNKRMIDAFIPAAYVAIQKFGIAKDKKVSGTYKGYIAAFGAAIIMGSLRSAIAFYQNQSGADTHREYLIKAIHALITHEDFDRLDDDSIKAIVNDTKNDSLMIYVNDEIRQDSENEYILKERICSAAVAIKLAMNMFEPIKE